MLDRDTKWRQGDLLTREAAKRLGLISSDGDDGCHVVVVSHDCDILHPKEPNVEIIVAHVVDKVDGQLSYAKNPRRLHLVYTLPNEQSLVLELEQARKRVVSREHFGQHAKTSYPATLPDEAKRTLKQWLAARYGRPAFPNAFEKRLRKKVGKPTVERKIAEILEPKSEHLVALFFDMGEQRGVELPDGEPYALSISVVYDATEAGPAARRSAEKVVDELNALFSNAYGEPEEATEIALDACEAVADTHMTLADLRRVDQWRLEYLSLCDVQSGDFLAVGELPG